MWWKVVALVMWVQFLTSLNGSIIVVDEFKKNLMATTELCRHGSCGKKADGLSSLTNHCTVHALRIWYYDAFILACCAFRKLQLTDPPWLKSFLWLQTKMPPYLTQNNLVFSPCCFPLKLTSLTEPALWIICQLLSWMVGSTICTRCGLCLKMQVCHSYFGYRCPDNTIIWIIM